jgi:type IV secretion system protein VirD4
VGLDRLERPLRRAPTVFRNASALSTLGVFCGLALAVVTGASKRRTPPSIAHGSSRWATTGEIERAGLLRDAGIVLGQTADAEFRTSLDRSGDPRTRLRRLGRLVRHDGPEHVFCFAPTRSGKGVGLVVPTLLSWTHSVLVYDIKKENWALTAGWRRQFSHALRFEPTALDSVRFNPLLEIRAGTSEVKDAQNVADILVDPTGESERKDHWQSTAHSLLVGAILHVLYAEPEKTLSGVATLLAHPDHSQRETLERMLDTGHLATGPHPVVAAAAREVLSKSDNERSGVFSTALACLGLYRDPIIARSTSASD